MFRYCKPWGQFLGGTFAFAFGVLTVEHHDGNVMKLAIGFTLTAMGYAMIRFK